MITSQLYENVRKKQKFHFILSQASKLSLIYFQYDIE